MSINAVMSQIGLQFKNIYSIKVLKENVTSTELGHSAPRKDHYFKTLKSFVHCKINVSLRVGLRCGDFHSLNVQYCT